MSIAAIVGVLFTAVLTPRVPLVEPGPVESGLIVDWDAPAGCGSADELRERLTDSLGPKDLEASIEIVGRVRVQPGLYTLELELNVGSERQRRSFSAEDCTTLLDAAVLVSSAALGPDPGVSGSERTDPPAGPAVSEPEAGPQPPRSPESPVSPGPAHVESPGAEEPASPPVASSEPDRSDRSSWARGRGRWLLVARAGIGYDGTLLSPIGALGFGYAASRWRVQLDVEGFGNRATGTTGDLDLGVVTLDPRAAAILDLTPRLELLLGGGIAVGPAIGRGRSVRNGRRAVVPWVDLHLDLGVLVAVRPRLALGAELSGYAMLVRPRFTLSDGQLVYRAGPAGGRASVVIALRFSATD